MSLSKCIFLLLISAGLVVFYCWQIQKKPVEQNTVSWKQKKSVEDLQVFQTKNSEKIQTLYKIQPFFSRPPINITKEQWPVLELRAIWYQPGGALAIINSDIVKEGDSVGNASVRVTRIMPSGVTLEQGNSVLNLKLGEKDH